MLNVLLQGGLNVGVEGGETVTHSLSPSAVSQLVCDIPMRCSVSSSPQAHCSNNTIKEEHNKGDSRETSRVSHRDVWHLSPSITHRCDHTRLVLARRQASHNLLRGGLVEQIILQGIKKLLLLVDT